MLSRVNDHNGSTNRGRRRWTVVLLILTTAMILAACGDDDGESPEDAYCAAADSLEANVEALADLDVVAEGTNAVSDRFDAISEDLEALREAGSEVAADDLAALEQAVDDLESAIGALGDDGITVDNASAVVDAIGRLGPAATAVVDSLSTACS